MSFEYLISFEALYQANRRAKRGKQQWKEEVISFQLDLGRRLWELHYELKYHRYQIGEYKRFMVYDPKEREIQAISYRDRIVQHSLCDNYLIPLVNPLLIRENVACQKGKGGSLALRLVRSYMKRCQGKGDYYYVFIDVSKFFDSIDHELLKKKLSSISYDEEANLLLEQFIDSYHKSPGKGLPMGNQSSQMFALLYLNEFDHYIKKGLREKLYVRYMDDALIFVKGRERAKQVLELAKSFIIAERLTPNTKSAITPLSQGVSFIGYRWRYGVNGKVIQTIKNENRRRMLKKIKARKIGNLELKQSLASYNGVLANSDSYSFKIRVRRLLYDKSSAK